MINYIINHYGFAMVISFSLHLTALIIKAFLWNRIKFYCPGSLDKMRRCIFGRIKGTSETCGVSVGQI